MPIKAFDSLYKQDFCQGDILFKRNCYTLYEHRFRF